MLVRQYGMLTVEDVVDRTIENANRFTFGARARNVLIGVVTLLAACTQGPGGGGIGLGSGQDPDPATVDFPIFYIRHQVPEDQDDVTRLRPFVEDDDYSATLWTVLMFESFLRSVMGTTPKQAPASKAPITNAFGT